MPLNKKGKKIKKEMVKKTIWQEKKGQSIFMLWKILVN